LYEQINRLDLTCQFKTCIKTKKGRQKAAP